MFKLKLVQCYHCWELGGHVKTTCAHRESAVICVKCAQPGHTQKDCLSETSKCHLCSGPHPANARCCPVYKATFITVFEEAMQEEANKHLQSPPKSNLPYAPSTVTSESSPNKDPEQQAWETTLHTAVNTSVITSVNPQEFVTSLFDLLKAGSPLTSSANQPPPNGIQDEHLDTPGNMEEDDLTSNKLLDTALSEEEEDDEEDVFDTSEENYVLKPLPAQLKVNLALKPAKKLNNTTELILNIKKVNLITSAKDITANNAKECNVENKGYGSIQIFQKGLFDQKVQFSPDEGIKTFYKITENTTIVKNKYMACTASWKEFPDTTVIWNCTFGNKESMDELIDCINDVATLCHENG